MADFSALTLAANVGNTVTPNWQSVLGSGRELRFHDTNGVSLATGSASWPYVTRPASGTGGVDYAYAFTADTTGNGVFGGGAAAAPAGFALAQYLQYRWDWDNLGTFASAPIMTAYPTTAHANPSRGDGSVLGGHASDTGGTARAYLKAAGWGRVTSAGAPAGGPGSVPLVTDGSTGTISPTAGANWSAWQGLMGDLDYITFPATPAAATADQWNVMMRLFMGANLAAGTYTWQTSLRYTYT